MRRVVRPLILLAILAIVAGVGATYYGRLKQQAGNVTQKPKALPPGTVATSHQWTYTHTTNEKTVITVHAEDLQEVEGKQQLSGVVLDIANKDGDKFHHVKSAKAEFDMAQGILYSEGEVEITMGVAPDAPPSGRLMVIKSSGIRVESKTGRAFTDGLTTIKFDRGAGYAAGGDYEPSPRAFALHRQHASV